MSVDRAKLWEAEKMMFQELREGTDDFRSSQLFREATRHATSDEWDDLLIGEQVKAAFPRSPRGGSR